MEGLEQFGTGTRELPAGAASVHQEPLLKRPLDIVLSTIGLLLSSPLWLLIAIAIKLDDGGDIFYEQERWGRGGGKCTVRKFRTMVMNADQRYGIQQAKQDDHRVTRAGRLLRATGMDELPQLLTIWRGEMSLVGPRALAIGEKVTDRNGEQVTYEELPGFRERLSVTPGLTSIATIFIPKDAHPRRKFRYDLLYIRRQSFWLDIYLVALSLWISIRGKWETRDRKF